MNVLMLVPFLFQLWVWECKPNRYVIDAQELDPSCNEGPITWVVEPAIPFTQVLPKTITIDFPPEGTYYVQVSSPNVGCAGFTYFYTTGFPSGQMRGR